MSSEKIDLLIGLVGDDHILSLFNIQDDNTLKNKFQAISPKEWRDVIHFRIKNYGVVGDCTSDLKEKISEPNSFLEQISLLDYTVLCIGTNDVLLDVPLPELVKNIQEILLMMLETGTEPVLCTIIPLSQKEYSETVVDANSILTIFCAKHKIKVVDLNVLFNDGNDRIDAYFDIGDGVHLTRDGYLFMADGLLLRIQEIIIKEYQEYVT
ncbi:MAG: SGNH/GDSL hydrolase family protein [Promethearchaeota archaeon]